MYIETPDIFLKVSDIVRLEFELTYSAVTIQHVGYYAIETPSTTQQILPPATDLLMHLCIRF